MVNQPSRAGTPPSTANLLKLGCLSVYNSITIIIKLRVLNSAHTYILSSKTNPCLAFIKYLMNNKATYTLTIINMSKHLDIKYTLNIYIYKILQPKNNII